VTWAGLVSVAAVLSWLGMVIGISLIETPLKFRAPGITLALALGIDRYGECGLAGLEYIERVGA
jgi:hypothetical protein